jgi:hypothetical protein
MLRIGQSKTLRLIQAANLNVLSTEDYHYFELLGKGGYGKVRRS